MLTREELIRDRVRLIDKAQGALCGVAIGDSFGDAARSPDHQANYGITTDFTTKNAWSTDDTEFALMTAQMLLDCCGELTEEKVVETWLKHVATADELKRGGSSEVEAAMNLRRGLRPPQSGQFNSYHCSDGAAMRCAPIGIICAGDPDRAVRLAGIDASISHYRDGVWGAQAVAAAVSLAMADAGMEEILDAVLQIPPKDSWFYATLCRAMRLIDDAQGEIQACWMPLHHDLFSTYRASVPEAVSQAFAVLRLSHDSFRSGLILAGNFGRDADTIAAVAGAILGARYGRSGIPADWVEKTRRPSGTCLQFTKSMDILECGAQLAELIV